MTPIATVLLVLALTGLGPAPAPGPAAGRDPSSAAQGVWPLPSHQVVAGFDPPDQDWQSGHRGVDLRGLPGDQVRAALSGTVTFAGPLAGRGVVVVSHGSRRTTYEPVLPWVRVGDQVAAGTPIGVLSPAGSHCPPGSCLHWGLIDGETYLDPLVLIGAARVRLLPRS